VTERTAQRVPKRGEGHRSLVTRLTVALATGWTAIVCVSLLWNINQLGRSAEESGRTQARASFKKDVLYRRWNAANGGVYGKTGEKTPPNPHLRVLERDIQTPTGRHLTLINPAYMTRQVHELGALEDGVLGHITSLNPIRPENQADEWEAAALKAFEKGHPEQSMVAAVGNAEYMRLMRPLKTETGCLKCHEAQGYKVGDIRGGISTSVPMTPLRAVARRHATGLALGHGLLWLLGMTGITLGGRRIRTDLVRARQAEEARERLETQLQQQHRLTSLGTLAGGVAHEINNPLNGIVNYAQLIHDRLEGSEDQELAGFTDGIMAESGRVVTIVRSLHALAHEGHGGSRATDMSELVGKVVALLEAMLRDDGVSLETNVPGGLPAVNCRPQAIRQVVLNLVNNALEAINARAPERKDAKVVRIKAQTVDDDDGTWLRLSIEDSGSSMPPDVVAHAFDPFFTTKGRAESAGLGLAISHRIAVEHGGRLQAETEPGKGSTLHLDLPISDASG